MTRKCPRCGEVKPLDDFNKNAGGRKDGLHSYCKECNRARGRASSNSSYTYNRGFNDYRTVDGIAYLSVNGRNGSVKPEEILVDEADLPLLISFGKRWNIDPRGYPITTGRKNYAYWALNLHRFLMSPPPGLEVDHINRIKLDNRRSNLRICTRAENAQNQDFEKRKALHHLRAESRTHCRKGHELTPENTFRYGHGRYRGCRTCRTAKTQNIRRTA